MTFQVELCYFSFAWLRSKYGEKSLLVEENAVEIRGVKELKKIYREREKEGKEQELFFFSACEGQRKSCRHCTSNQIGKDPVIKV